MNENREFSGRLKGQFTSQSKLKAKRNISEAWKQRWIEYRERKALEKARGERGNLALSTKRRVVELS